MAVLAAAAAAWVLAPLRTDPLPARESGSSASGQPEPLRSEAGAAGDALRDLELDHATGKVSEDDYRLLRARYGGQASETGRPSRGSPA